MHTFARKGWGRIYCVHEEDIALIEIAIKEMDPFEYEYLPEKFITTFDQYPKLEYTHKFDSLDINLLTKRLWQKGIKIFCLDNGHEEFIQPKE